MSAIASLSHKALNMKQNTISNQMNAAWSKWPFALRNSKLILTLLFLGILNLCSGQQKESGESQIPSLGRYWFVMYSKGPDWKQDSVTRAKISRDHINYIVGLRKTGKIITGGAFLDKAIWTGFEIYNSDTKEEVLKITEADPMVSAKIFSYEIHPWTTLKGVVKFE
jgi:uncharacterized protein YciI